jgi:hypothetical protein
MARDSEHRKTDRQLMEETAQRARRIETRVTMIANHLGIDAGAERPVLRGNTLYVNSLKTSLEDIVTAIGSYSGQVSVYCGEDYVLTAGV